MGKNSCGAIFCTISDQGVFGIILGDEGITNIPSWLPFKGCVENDETYEQTAIREIKEESCNLVDISTIKLNFNFSTRNKTYHLGLVKVPYDIIAKFNEARQLETRREYVEKKALKFFSLKSLRNDDAIHHISQKVIKYYWTALHYVKKNIKKYSTFYGCVMCEIAKNNQIKSSTTAADLANIPATLDYTNNVTESHLTASYPTESHPTSTHPTEQHPPDNEHTNVSYQDNIVHIPKKNKISNVYKYNSKAQRKKRRIQYAIEHGCAI